MSKKTWIIIGIIVIVLITIVSSYNGLISKSQVVDNAWGNVQTNYQRRADLVPNLVSTVKGAANFEQQTLTAVVEARASATGINLSAKDLTPENIQKYQAAQDQLSGSLSRLLVVAENYPTLQATAAFRDLQAQLEGTENRIAVSRKDFNDAVLSYNTTAASFPTVIFAKLFGFNARGYFEATIAAQTVPTVDFTSTTTVR